MAVTLRWTRAGLPTEIAQALDALTQDYPLREEAGSPQLRFAHEECLAGYRLERKGADLQVTYGAVCDALRAVGAALAGMPDGSSSLSEQRPFRTLGIMLDCSRNAVMTVEHVKLWLRRLALLGYNMTMLYTEDTYQLPDEPFFGLFRGAYSPDELKDIDAYASRLGIEMIGCIQTLGHLEQLLKWGAYHKVRDTDRELLIGEPATYDLIRKMISSFADCFRSRRIHVGMDETWTLGRGRYLDLHGKQSGHDMLTQHLAEVCRICDEQGMRPMMWSDMFFRFGGDMHSDYDDHSHIPDEVRNAIPRNLDLVYWDYSRDTEQEYLQTIERHRSLGREPLMGSGVWTWLRVWYGRAETEAYAAPCVRASKQAGLGEIFFTMWGDDGGYCEFDSALAGLAFCAAETFGEGEEALKRRFQAVCGMDYDLVLLGCQLEFPARPAGDPWNSDNMAGATLWDDPLLGMHALGVGARYPGHWQRARDHYRALAQQLALHRAATGPVDMGHAAALADLLAAKIAFRLDLEEAYPSRRREAFQQLAGEARRLAELVEALEATFRRQWLGRNKAFGMEAIQVRLGGLRQRYLEVSRLLAELAEGSRAAIPELDEGLGLSLQARKALRAGNRYRSLATAGIL
ncbi:MAG: family 20 glycosylhydrolase [Armatimonadota bacterium]